jgi:hypothetical protein
LSWRSAATWPGWRLEVHFAAHPGAYERYRELRVTGALEPTAAERIELRKETDKELKARIKRLHASKDQKDNDALAKLLKDDERAAGLWGEMCLTGEIVPVMPS